MKQKRKNKITKQQEHIPRPAVFTTKKDYNRQAQKREARKQCKEAY